MDQKLTKEIKTELLNEKKNLEGELSKIAKKKGKKFTPVYPEYGSKDEENAAELTEYGIHLALDKNLEKLLSRTVAALLKIEQGTYGRCEDCNKTINPERLKAIPSSILCIECQAKREKNPFRKLVYKIQEQK